MLSRVNASNAIAPIQSGSQREARLERKDLPPERDRLERQPPAVRERERGVQREWRQECRRRGDARGEREPEAEQQQPKSASTAAT